MPLHYDPEHWCRLGRGREFQFAATDEEICGYLRSGPAELAPYDIVGSTLVRDGKHFRPKIFVMSLDEYCEALVRRTDVPRNVFLRSLASGSELPPESDCDGWWSLNGLLLVQPGFMRDGRRTSDRIAITNRIRCEATREVVEHSVRVFEALRRRIRADQRYVSIARLADETEVENDRLLMSEAAAELGRRGELTVSPGRALMRRGRG